MSLATWEAGLTLLYLDLIVTNSPAKTLMSKQGHTPPSRGIRISTHLPGGHNSTSNRHIRCAPLWSEIQGEGGPVPGFLLSPVVRTRGRSLSSEQSSVNICDWFSSVYG